MELKQFFSQVPRAALAFSGGVDSAFLLSSAVSYGADVRPYFIKTPFQPAFELADAQRLCAQFGVELTVIPLNILDCDLVRANPPDRCYHCKKALFTALQDQARADGYSILLDGTNASDKASDRPGMRALQEMEVRSPLRECGLTKSRIRELSRAAGLFTWEKPAYACLATRFPSGVSLSADGLSRVEAAEDFLMRLGFSDFRVRVFYGAARIQLPGPQFSQAVLRREEIRKGLAEWFDVVLLDLAER